MKPLRISAQGFFYSIRLAWRFYNRRFTDQCVSAVLAARGLASEQRHHEITPEHVLFGVGATLGCTGRAALENLGLDLAREGVAIRALTEGQVAEGRYHPPTLSPATERLLSLAEEESRSLGLHYVATQHLVLALLTGSGRAGEYLREHGVTVDRLLAELRRLTAGPYESSRAEGRGRSPFSFLRRGWWK
jgi:ATP-dependent Clp protease ATP-binding subunit ClpC